MSHVAEHYNPASLGERLRGAHAMSRQFMLEVIDKGCRRLHSRSEGSARLMGLIDAEAWTDVALALLELELPLWQMRRIVYDEGEWYCALSRERELPDWLDNSVEARHTDLALALLSAFVEAQALTTQATRPSGPSVRRASAPLYEPVFCDNFG